MPTVKSVSVPSSTKHSFLVRNDQKKMSGNFIQSLELTQTSIQRLSDHIELITQQSVSLNELEEKLTAIDYAQLNACLAFTIGSIYFTHLRVRGIDHTENPIAQELERVKLYMKKIIQMRHTQQLGTRTKTNDHDDDEEKNPSLPRFKVDAEVVNRVVKFYTTARASLENKQPNFVDLDEKNSPEIIISPAAVYHNSVTSPPISPSSVILSLPKSQSECHTQDISLTSSDDDGEAMICNINKDQGTPAEAKRKRKRQLEPPTDDDRISVKRKKKRKKSKIRTEGIEQQCIPTSSVKVSQSSSVTDGSFELPRKRRKKRKPIKAGSTVSLVPITVPSNKKTPYRSSLKGIKAIVAAVRKDA